ncbi:hypothetical protein CC86DRAFT_402861 [Ophiobolus disseminans]|uniref:Uncharacterized protein n=1 Tax=Ophiobolus disseminans TaxID=1469910 RepID=A0A6A7AC97_9PLEO|nr:hypothetical protein CC86DRAFT_402861 [Ophiobolus disseminans]
MWNMEGDEGRSSRVFFRRKRIGCVSESGATSLPCQTYVNEGLKFRPTAGDLMVLRKVDLYFDRVLSLDEQAAGKKRSAEEARFEDLPRDEANKQAKVLKARATLMTKSVRMLVPGGQRLRQLEKRLSLLQDPELQGGSGKDILLQVVNRIKQLEAENFRLREERQRLGRGDTNTEDADVKKVPGGMEGVEQIKTEQDDDYQQSLDRILETSGQPSQMEGSRFNFDQSSAEAGDDAVGDQYWDEEDDVKYPNLFEECDNDSVEPQKKKQRRQ